MEQFPILLCPVAAIPAFGHGERSWKIDGQTVEYLDAWSYSEWFNLLGNPAAVVPVGRSPEGLPIGVQLVGRPWGKRSTCWPLPRHWSERAELGSLRQSEVGSHSMFVLFR